ncbi:hypothetical protein [Novosphingobium sp. SG720]|uniref:hypothetical protein n=1 Tax=Novosphingobium sp. SG720 TaxID=2586998 RepID=UPI00144553BD|nr:hypothetical protein [Novosphingobium sp. SG720]NKJ42407.1 hypothetical protein [Novosphingobium sp. SG720]
MRKDAEAVERAFVNFWKRTYPINSDRKLTLAFLIRAGDWRPLDASWWRGKEVSIIGADIYGNFLLRHCDGSVRYWDHQRQTDEIIASSVVEFCERIE